MEKTCEHCRFWNRYPPYIKIKGGVIGWCRELQTDSPYNMRFCRHWKEIPKK